MTACHRDEQYEVAVKFIIKANVPDYAWMEDGPVGRLPIEVFLLCSIDHENIVKCMDLFEDDLYFYLVQELHGSPWSTTPPMPSLLASTSEDSLANPDVITTPVHSPDMQDTLCRSRKKIGTVQCGISTSSLQANARPNVQRRPSYDLFECIEQSKLKRLTADQAQYVFAQVVEAAYYLDCQGITHRDIKDENLVIDKNFKVKLIDFGSAVIADPDRPRPFYKRFYGTTAYAAPEILLKKRYRAPPAEVWTLGVLLSYLLTGTHPFPTVEDAVDGNFVLTANSELPEEATVLMRRCLDPNPETRATIREIKDHAWLIPSNGVS
ncbi:hypothetical protein AX15_005377 [Amanita polypyramis BW_CC]|nr:hypothetical protein AX15_005377 [Amanita polypyramis BW_CC]